MDLRLTSGKQGGGIYGKRVVHQQKFLSTFCLANKMSPSSEWKIKTTGFAIIHQKKW